MAECKITEGRITITDNGERHLEWYMPERYNYKGFLVGENSNYGGTMYHMEGRRRFEPMEKTYITKVLYNNPATVVFWSDGTKTRNVCPQNTLYNPDAGLAFCVLKKFMGGDEMAKLFKDWELADYREDKNHWVELKDVRKKHKENK